jgi:hypothetical protein
LYLSVVAAHRRRRYHPQRRTALPPKRESAKFWHFSNGESTSYARKVPKLGISAAAHRARIAAAKSACSGTGGMPIEHRNCFLVTG